MEVEVSLKEGWRVSQIPAPELPSLLKYAKCDGRMRSEVHFSSITNNNLSLRRKRAHRGVNKRQQNRSNFKEQKNEFLTTGLKG